MPKEYSYSEKVGAVLGELVRMDGTDISLAKYNRLAVTFDMLKLKKTDLQGYVSQLKNPVGAPLDKTFELVKTGKLDLTDIFGYTTANDMDAQLAYGVPSTVKMDLDLKQQKKEYKARQRGQGYYEIFLNKMLEELRYSLRSDFKPVLAPKIKKGKDTNSFLMLASDTHLGAEIDVEGNHYDYDTMLKRWNTYLATSIQQAKDRGLTHITFLHIGDIIEQVTMRANQGFTTEFNLSEEISKAIVLIKDALQVLGKDFTVDFGIIAGNHDRLQGGYKEAIDFDSAAYIVLKMIKMLSEEGALPNVNVIDNSEDIYSLDLDIQGKNVFVTHGEQVKPSAHNNIVNLMHDKPYDVLIYGHYHNLQMANEDYDRLTLGLPTMQGWNEYSIKHNFPKCAPAQCNLVLSAQGQPEILPIFLQGK